MKHLKKLLEIAVFIGGITLSSGLVVAVAIWLAMSVEAASQGGTPKLQTGKIYDAIYGCTRQIVKVEDGLAGADACYAEVWIVLETGKDGWYRIGDLKAGAEWYVNLNRISAIREHVEPKEISTPAEADPGPRIQASGYSGDYSGPFSSTTVNGKLW